MAKKKKEKVVLTTDTGDPPKLGPAEEDVDLGSVKSPIPARAEHVVHPGEKTRPPTEEEILARQPSPEAALEEAKQGPAPILAKYKKAIEVLRVDRTKWTALSPVQRYALIGAYAIICEALGELGHDGKKRSLAHTLGFDVVTCRSVTTPTA